jgi:hypothetical protein
MDQNKLEYEKCECHAGCHGPAVYAVTRDGRRINVCTRCTFDGEDEKLIITRQHDPRTLMNYDALGAYCVMSDLVEAKDAR